MPQPDDAVPAARRRNMAAIKGRDTKPELIVRRQLHAAGFRFRLHRPDLPGRPDIALPKYRTVIFVHGCFWHRHNCRYFKWPKTRAAFWRDKIGANVLRDRKRRLELERLGWKVLVVWECETRSEPFSTLHKLSGTIRSGGSRL
jgi:DNA mismatch endonuclease (patch repair protein)